MLTEYAWFLPTGRYGDGHRINEKTPERPPTVEYMSEVARAAERAGFVNLLLPTGTHCLDAWMMGAAVAARTERIKFCVAFRPGLMSPVLTAQQANTFDVVTGGRLTVNVVTGSTQVDQKRYGDHLDHDARYERTDEFLDIVKALWAAEEPVTYKGKFHDIEEATLYAQPVSKPHPTIFLGASSEAGRKVGAKHADVHMMWAVEMERVIEDVADMKRRAAELGRENDLRFGLRIHIVCRETKKEARRAAESLIEGSEIGNTRVWADMRNKTESEGQRRMNELGSRGSLWITETMWMGVNAVRSGAGATLVGTPEMVAGALREYVDAGVSNFILSGWPHVEEAEIFGREVMPLLRDTEPAVL
jgi:alkanesulfonate monooxygenase